MIIALIIIAVILIALVVMANVVFRIAFAAKHKFEGGPGQYENVEKVRVMDRVRSAMEYVNSLPCERVFATSADGLKLSARYYDHGSKRVIILVHGYRSKAEYDFGCSFDMFKEQGFNILLIDQRAHGMSEGKYITFGVKEREDCRIWADYAANELGADDIILCGISMGAASVLMATELGLNEKVSLIEADSGFTSPKDILLKVIKGMKIPCGGFILWVTNLFACMPIGRFNIYAANAPDALKKNTIPVVFVHGEADGFVPCEMSKINYDACAAKKAIVTVPGADHGMAFLVDEEKVRRAYSDFAERL